VGHEGAAGDRNESAVAEPAGAATASGTDECARLRVLIPEHKYLLVSFGVFAIQLFFLFFSAIPVSSLAACLCIYRRVSAFIGG